MQGYRLRWYQEPGDPLHYRLMRDLAENLRRAACDGREPSRVAMSITHSLWRDAGRARPFSRWTRLSATAWANSDACRMRWKRTVSRCQLYPHGGHMIALHIDRGQASAEVLGNLPLRDAAHLLISALRLGGGATTSDSGQLKMWPSPQTGTCPSCNASENMRESQDSSLATISSDRPPSSVHRYKGG